MVKNRHRYRKKLKVETEEKEIEQQLLNFVTIEIIKVEEKIFRTRYCYFAYGSNHQRLFL